MHASVTTVSAEAIEIPFWGQKRVKKDVFDGVWKGDSRRIPLNDRCCAAVRAIVIALLYTATCCILFERCPILLPHDAL